MAAEEDVCKNLCKTGDIHDGRHKGDVITMMTKSEGQIMARITNCIQKLES